MRLERVDLADLDAPYAVALIYPRHASALVANWLHQVGFDGGDIAMGGADVLAAYRGAAPAPIAACRLATSRSCATRSPEEILRTVNEAVQR